MKTNRKNEMINLIKKNEKKVILCLSLFILLILILCDVIGYNRNFEKIKLSTNNEKIFTVDDLVINDLKFGEAEKNIKEKLGNPKKESTKTIDKYTYKILEYDKLTLTLKENYNSYILTKADINSSKYTTSRNLEVGNKISTVFSKFKVENNYGAYLYGNYTNNSLNDNSIVENIYYGIRSNKNVLFINKDKKIENIPTNIAKLNIEYKNGKITRITWSYDEK